MTRDMSLVIAARVAMSAARALAGILTPIHLALLGFSALQMGVLFSLVALTSALLSMGIGLLSDRIGRKPFLVIVPVFAAAAACLFAFTTTGALLFIFAALGSFGRGAGAGGGAIGPYQPAEQALLAEHVPDRFRNALFGRVAFASSLGALLGSPLAGLTKLSAVPGVASAAGAVNGPGAVLSMHRPAFLAAAALALLAALLAAPVREKPRSAAVEPRAKAAPTGSRRRTPLSRTTWRILFRLWVTNGLNGLAVGFFGPFITYWFYARYGVGAAEVGILYTIVNLVSMLSNLSAARIAGKLGLVRSIVVSRVFQAVLILPMVLAPTFWLAGTVYLVRMLAQRVGLPLRQSFVMGVVPPEERGRAGALSNLSSQATSALSPSAAGALFDHAAFVLPFSIGALLQALNTLFFYLFFRRVHPPEERTARPVHEDSAENTEH